MKVQFISLIPLKSFQNNTRPKLPILFYFTFIFTQWIYAFSRRFYPKWLTIEEHRQSITKPMIFTTPGLLGNKPRPELKCKGKINIIWYLLFYWFLNHFLYFSFYIYLIFLYDPFYQSYSSNSRPRSWFWITGNAWLLNLYFQCNLKLLWIFHHN